MSNLLRSYTKILSLLHDIEPKDNFFMRRRPPKLSDKQLLALSLATETLGIDSERYLSRRVYPTSSMIRLNGQSTTASAEISRLN
jgi:hypothetical protein